MLVYVVLYSMDYEGSTLVLVTNDRNKAVDTMRDWRERLKGIARVRVEVWEAAQSKLVETLS